MPRLGFRTNLSAGREAAKIAQAAERAGETIYKGHRSYDLMLNLQLGIRHAVGSLASAVPSSGPGLLAQDFASKVGLANNSLPGRWTCKGQTCSQSACLF